MPPSVSHFTVFSSTSCSSAPTLALALLLCAVVLVCTLLVQVLTVSPFPSRQRPAVFARVRRAVTPFDLLTLALKVVEWPQLSNRLRLV